MPCLPRLAHEAPVMKATQFCYLLLQGTVQRRRGQQEKRWGNNISEWTGLRFCNTSREAENKIKWRERVALSVAPQRSPRLHNRCRYLLISQVGPAQPGGQVHRKLLVSLWHVPLFLQGDEAQKSIAARKIAIC